MELVHPLQLSPPVQKVEFVRKRLDGICVATTAFTSNPEVEKEDIEMVVWHLSSI